MKRRILRIFEKLAPAPDALVLVNSAEPHLDQSFFYLFDAESGLFEAAVAVAFPDGTLQVLSPPLEEESALQAAKSDADVTVKVPQTPEERDAEIRSLLPNGGTVALNYHELTYENFLMLTKLFPSARWVDAAPAIRQTRVVKDEREVERLERAGAIASTVARKIPSFLKRGITELDLAGEIEYQMMREGAGGRSFATIAAFGSHGAEPHFSPGARALEPGSSIVCDFGALFQRYASDITRSFRFGPADPELRRIHETVEAAQKAALETVRPGVAGKEVHLAAERVIDQSPWKGRFNHGVGHSIGLAVHDGWGMNRRTEDVLQAGMAITIEPGIYLPGRGGVRIEDDILVTDGGYRFLTTAPREYVEVAA